MNLEKMRADYEAAERDRAAREAAAAERYAGFDDGLLAYAGERVATRRWGVLGAAALTAVTAAAAVVPLLAFYMFYSPELFGGTAAGLALCAIAAAMGLRRYLGWAEREREDIASELARRAAGDAARGRAGRVSPAAEEKWELTDAEYDAVSSLDYEVREVATALASRRGSRFGYRVTSPEGMAVLRDAMELAGCRPDDERVAFIAGEIEAELLGTDRPGPR